MRENSINHNLIAYMDDEFEENVDSINDTEETVQPEDSTEDETLETEPEVDIAQLQATNKKLFERAKKAEADLKALKSAKQPVKQKQASSSVDVEETILLANGMDEELVEQLKKVAQVQGLSLIKAQNDPIFVAVKEKFEKDKKQEQASMGASRGSGQSKPRKDFKTPGLKEDEFKEMFNARFN